MDLTGAMYRGAFDFATNGMIVVDEAGTIVQANPAAEQLFGPAKRWLGRPVLEIDEPARTFLAEVFARLPSGMAGPLPDGSDGQVGEASIEGQGTLRAADGDRRLEYRVEPGFVGGRTLAIFVDATQRWEAEERLRYLAEASAVLSASLDYQTTLTSVAELAVPRLADWSGVDMVAEDGSIQKLATVHVDPAKVAWSWELTRRYPIDPNAPAGAPAVIRTGRPEVVPDIPEEMLRAVSPDEEALRILRELGLRSYICVPMIARGRTLGAITFVFAESGRRYDERYLAMAEELARRAAVAIDNARLYREARAAEAQVRRLNESLERRVQERTAQLEELNRELEAFSYSVSHDLRAPIRHISGFADMLQRRSGPELNEAGRRYVRIILDSAKLAGNLIDDLLSFSRMGRTEIRHSPVPLGQLVADVQSELALESEGRVIRWHVSPLPDIVGDPAMIRLVIRNLLANAVKYTRRRDVAEIDVDCVEEGGEHHLRIRDNGVGFDMKYVEKLFGVFQRLHTAEEFEGTGIGLATVRRIVHRHGGRCWAEGALDRGATFHVTLPRGTGRGADGQSEKNPTG